MTIQTAQTPMTVEEVFDGYDFRTVGGREGTTFYFRGHLASEEIAATYARVYPDPDVMGSYRIDPASGRHAWHVFTAHSEDCVLAPGGDEYGPFEPHHHFLCTCEASQNYETLGLGYEYRHPHQATASTPGAVAVTWAEASWTRPA